MADDDTPMPGQNEFSAEEEQQMRQARAAQNADDGGAGADAGVAKGYSSMRPSTNVEDVRNKPIWQRGIEAVTRKSLPQMQADLTRRLGLGPGQ